MSKLVGAVLVAAVSGAAALMTLGSADTGHALTSCSPAGLDIVQAAAATSDTSPVGTLPASIGPFKGTQITNAAHIITAGKALSLDARSQTIAVMTAIGESTLIVVDHGDQAGPDSRGLFQQRAGGAWGTYADRMNPQISATNFYKALQQVPGWQFMAPTLAAHAVQHNADPYHYERYWSDAVQVVATLSGDPNLASKLPTAGGLPCAPSDAGTYTGDGSITSQPCSIVPDPTTGRGCLTPRTAALATQLKSHGWSLSCWDAHAWNPLSDHPLGRACDVFPGKGGVLPTAAQKATGDALAASLIASAKSTGINYVIWYGQIWSVERANEGWRPYGGGGIYDPTAVTGGHYDHVHVSVH